MTPPSDTLLASPPAAPVLGRVPADRVPARAAGVELLGRLAGSGYRRPPWLIRRADGQTFQCTPILYRLLEGIDGRRDDAELAAQLSEQIGKVATADDVRFLVENKLRPLGVLRSLDGADPEVARSNPLLALRWRVVVSKPAATRRLTDPLTGLFRPLVVVAVMAAFVAVSVWLLLDKGLAAPARQALYEPELLLAVFALTVLSTGFHELGHAAACRYGGATPGVMGAGLYLVWPAFYTDVTDSYRLGRRGRLRVDLGGLYFNAVFAVATFGLWAVVRWDALLVVIPLQLLQMVRQLVPLVRFDGYHILADLIGVLDLFAHIKPVLVGMLPTRWGRGEEQVLERWARVVVTAWVVVVVPVLAFSLVMMVVALPRLAATAWDSLGLHGSGLYRSWGEADLAGVGVGLVSVIVVALPVLAVCYLLARVGRRTSRRVWRATDGRPAARTVAVVFVAAMAAALASVWWPTGQYQPIQAGERGTLVEGIQAVAEAPSVIDALPAVAPPAPRTVRATSGGPALASPGEPLAVGLDAPRAGERTAAAATGMQGSTATEPRSADLVPAAPFTFRPPPPPGAGDNQALAINTEDGSTIVKLAFKLVMAADGRVDERNEAYALASCSDCRTFAVAFQLILIIGQADRVVPENVAVALNVSCAECVTYAVAMQLVVSLAGPLSDQDAGELDAVWAQLADLEATIDTTPPAELHRALTTIQREILDVLERADVPAQNESDTFATTDGGASAESPTDPASVPPAGASEPPSGETAISDPTTGESGSGIEPASDTTVASEPSAGAAGDDGEPAPNGTAGAPPPDEPAISTPEPTDGAGGAPSSEEP